MAPRDSNSSQENREIREDLRFQLLEFLDRTPSTVSKAARELDVSAATVHNYVDRLRERDWVRGVTSGTTSPYTADVIYTTEDGHRVLVEAQKQHENFFSSWPEPEPDEPNEGE